MEILKFVFIRQECQPANIISGYTLEQLYAMVVIYDDDSEAAEAIVGGLEASCACDECGEVARLLGAIFHQRGAESTSRREVRLGAQAPSCCHTAPPTPPRL